jgi:hypothetical protein
VPQDGEGSVLEECDLEEVLEAESSAEEAARARKLPSQRSSWKMEMDD